MTTQTTTHHVMNRRGLKAIARELLTRLRPEVAKCLRAQCGAYMRNVGKSTILAEWATVAELEQERGHNSFEVGRFYSKTGEPQEIWLDSAWFDSVEIFDYCSGDNCPCAGGFGEPCDTREPVEIGEAKRRLEEAVSDLPLEAQARYRGSDWRTRNEAWCDIQGGGDPVEVARACFGE